MADEKTQDSTDVSFAAEPRLQAETSPDGGPTTIEFDAEPDLAEPKRSAAQTLKDEAGKLGSQAAERARAFAGEGKERATGALDELSKMMSDAAGTVDEKLGEDYGRYARSAADSISGFAEALREKQVDELVEDARNFVRSSPAVAIGVAAALGFVVARLIKSGVDAAADFADRDETDGKGKG